MAPACHARALRAPWAGARAAPPRGARHALTPRIASGGRALVGYARSQQDRGGETRSRRRRPSRRPRRPAGDDRPGATPPPPCRRANESRKPMAVIFPRWTNLLPLVIAAGVVVAVPAATLG